MKQNTFETFPQYDEEKAYFYKKMIKYVIQLTVDNLNVTSYYRDMK